MPPRVLVALWLFAVCLVGQQHNLLVVVADDLGVDYVGCYGEGTNPPPTPNLDALAANGVLFRNAWAYPSCSPTRACIQTGRHPFRTMVGRWIAHAQLPPNVGLLLAHERTLPKVLDAAGSGYAHALIGKWHLGNVQSDVDGPRTIGGWSHFAGSLEGQIPSYTSWTRVVDGVAATTTSYCTTQNTDDALAWIQSQAGPWLCVLTYQAPHIPYHAPPSSLHTQNLTGLTPAQNHTPANIPFYRAMVESLDTELGRLFATLGPAVMAETNVFFLADNGTVQQQSVAPFDGSRSKGTQYEGGINVPLLVSGPAVQQPGRQVDALVCAVDVFPTVVELAGASAGLPPFVPIDGVSLAPYLDDPQQAPIRTFAFSEQFVGTEWPAPENNGYAICRDDRYKLVHHYSGATDQLYDLQLDPWENSNLIASANPAVQAARTALLDEIDRLRGEGGAGAFAVFGDGACVGSFGIPQIAATGTAETGAAYTVQLGSARPLAFAIHVFGLSWQAWSGGPLPLPLQALGAHQACILSSSPDVLTLGITGFGGAASQLIQVPSSPALVGETVFSAWVVLDAQAPGNAAGLVATNSLAVSIRS